MVMTMHSIKARLSSGLSARGLIFFALMAIIGLSSCGKGINPVDATLTENTGDLSLSVRIQSTAAAAGMAKAPATDFTLGVANLTKAGSNVSFPLVVSGGRAIGSITGLPAGVWTVEVHFYNAEMVETFSGSTTVTVKNGKNTVVSLAVIAKGGSLSLEVQLPDYTLWNALESEFSEEGPALEVIRNPSRALSFVPSVFGLGFDAVDIEQHLVIPENAYQLAKGTIEFWFTPHWNQGQKEGGGAYLLFPKTMSGGRAPFYFVLGSDGSLTGYFAGSAAVTNNLSGMNYIVAGQPIHFGLCWDASGIESSGHTGRIYVNGVLSALSANAINTTQPTCPLVMGFHYDDAIYSVDLQTLYQPNGTFDNLKIYPYAKTHFDDRFFE